MYLWNTEKLAEQIASDQLSADTKFQYLLASNILFAVVGYIVWYLSDVPTPSEFNYWLEALLILIITVGGTLKCKEAFAPAKGLSLIESFFILSLPLSIKLYLFMAISLALIPVAVEYIAATQHTIITNNIETAADFLNAIYLHHGTALEIATVIWFFWRMKHHLSRIAEATPNQPLKRDEVTAGVSEQVSTRSI